MSIGAHIYIDLVDIVSGRCVEIVDDVLCIQNISVTDGICLVL